MRYDFIMNTVVLIIRFEKPSPGIAGEGPGVVEEKTYLARKFQGFTF